MCTFSNETQGVEEGLCTECSCAEGYSGTNCASKEGCLGSKPMHTVPELTADNMHAVGVGFQSFIIPCSSYVLCNVVEAGMYCSIR